VEVDTAAVVAQLLIPRSDHWDAERLHRRVVRAAHSIIRDCVRG
jgi:folate-dependent phosphoribosylglycinamide formyltransferase PurN